MWFQTENVGPSIIGFGTCHYKYESGREGDMPLAAFSPRTTAIVFYLSANVETRVELLKKLGKHETDKGCIYVKKLDDINMDVLKEMISVSVKHKQSLCIAEIMRESGEALVAKLGNTKGLKVLDLGCGDGTTALPEARLGANVLGVDIARNLVDAGNIRAKKEGLTNCTFQEGGATDLQELEDHTFDLVVSIFGAMFAPKPFDVAHGFENTCYKGHLGYRFQSPLARIFHMTVRGVLVGGLCPECSQETPPTNHEKNTGTMRFF